MSALTTVADVIVAAQAIVADLRSKLPEPDGATAKRAQVDAAEALGVFERSIQLLTFEAARQAGVAEARAKAAVARAEAEATRKAEAERAEHVRVLKQEAARSVAIEKARAYLKSQQKAQKGTTP